MKNQTRLVVPVFVRVTVYVTLTACLPPIALSPTCYGEESAAFLVDQSQKLVFPVPSAVSDGVTILLSSRIAGDENELLDARIEVEYIVDPNGRPHKVAVDVQPEIIKKLSNRKIPVKLLLTEQLFQKSGDYQVHLLLKGRREKKKAAQADPMVVKPAGGDDAGGDDAGDAEAGGAEAGGAKAGGAKAGGAKAGGAKAGGAKAGVAKAGVAKAAGTDAGGTDAGGAKAGGTDAGGAKAGGAEKGEGADEKSAFESISETVVIHIQRPKGEINVDALTGQSIRITRRIPGRSIGVHGTMNLKLQEKSGNADLINTIVEPGPIHVAETKEQVAGRITIHSGDSESNKSGATEAVSSGVTKIRVPAGRSHNVAVEISGIYLAGEYTSNLSVTADTLDGTSVIPIKITVSDCWFWPLLFITLGVVGGTTTRYLVKVARPRLLNLNALDQLRVRIARHRELVLDDEKRSKLDDIKQLLQEAAQHNLAGQFAESKKVLDQAEKNLGEFLKKEATDREAAWTKHDDLTAQLEAYERLRRSDMSTKEQADIDSIRAILLQAKEQLGEDRIDAATASAKRAEDDFADAKREVVKNDCEALEKSIASLEEAIQGEKTEQELSDDEKTRLKELKAIKTALAAALKQTDPDKALQQLVKISGDLERLRDHPATSLAALPMQGVGRLAAMGRASVAKAKDELHIVVRTPLPQCTTDARVQFMLQDPKNELQPNDQLDWQFGDGSDAVTSIVGRPISHRFRGEQTYSVNVQISRGDPAVVAYEAVRDITIQPGKAEQTRRLYGQKLKAIDFALLALGVVLGCITGLMVLFAGKTFGTVTDYSLALLWGFGIDSSVKGFSDVLTRVGFPEDS